MTHRNETRSRIPRRRARHPRHPIAGAGPRRPALDSAVTERPDAGRLPADSTFWTVTIENCLFGLAGFALAQALLRFLASFVARAGI